MIVDYLDYDADEGVAYLTEDAPDEILEWAEDDPDYAGVVIYYAVVMGAAGYEDADDIPSLHECRKQADKHYSKMRMAVDDGDIETAQDEKKIAEMLVEVDERLCEYLNLKNDSRDTVPKLR